MASKRVVVIEGEDAAPEAVRPTVQLLEQLVPTIEWIHPPVGDAGLEQHGSLFPDASRRAIDASDATLFGATSGKNWEAIRYLRWGRQTYANIRPARWFPGCRSPLVRPEGIDFVIVRENLEDLYLGVEGDLEELRPLKLQSRTAGCAIDQLAPGKFAVKVITEVATRRVARFAFELARQRQARSHPGKVTCSCKYNMLAESDGLFLRTVQQVATEFPGIELETFIVDDFARRIIAAPQELDVVVLPNLYGDILSDLAAGVIGGLGLAPSGCYGDDYAYFESIHGSAPDIAGQNIINPTATLLSGAMLLDYLGFAAEARRLKRSIESVYAEGASLTPDQGGSASTTGFCEAVASHL